jgi:hypothetical protein
MVVAYRSQCVEALGKVEGGTAYRGEGSTSGLWRTVGATTFDDGEGTLWLSVVGEAPTVPGGGGKSEGWLDSTGGVVPAELTVKGKR